MWIFQKSPFLDFNPRSREGSDHRAYCFVDRFVYFNPRSREGSDVDTTFLIVFKIVISTHAPARGATAIRFQSAMLLLCISTHAPARGATPSISCVSRCLNYFNPRSREGSDDVPDSSRTIFLNFNPRSREGSDVAPVGTV